MKFNVKAFGAIGDGISKDTAFIQKAIDDCSEMGGGEVIFPSGIYLSGTIILKNNVTLNLEKDSMIFGSQYFEDYNADITPFTDAVGQERGKCLIFAEDACNIGIKGKGIIHGRGRKFDREHPFFSKRPFLLRMVGCKNINIEGITMRDSAAWCSHYLDCEDVEVKDVSIISRVNANNDGIDIDSCRNFRVTGCFIDTGDDGICLKSTIDKPCENIMVKDCSISSNWAAFKIGTESVGDFKNIEVSDCCMYDTEGCGIKLVPVDGGNLDNVTITNIEMINCTGPVFIGLGERLRKYFNNNSVKNAGTIKNIHIRGIKADVKDAKGIVYRDKPWGNARGCITLSGIQGHRLENIIFEDMNIVMPGGGTEKEVERADIPEMGTQYPEFHVFGVLPAYGFFIRHADRVRIKNVQLSLKEKDKRFTVFCKDVKNLDIIELSAPGGVRCNE